MSENAKITNLKFLHCSDIHLDSPFFDVTPEKSEERRRELRSTFMRLMEFVRDKGVDYVLISGDLFDTKYATNVTLEILLREFRNCPETQFIIAPLIDCQALSPSPAHMGSSRVVAPPYLGSLPPAIVFAPRPSP